ncbi:MAG: phospho-sugar mutase [Eubacteriaceae bacterium]|nr:phospho-sugar mutase [Eubacteriaceae bacterium]
MDTKIRETYELWLRKALRDRDLTSELESVAGDEAAVTERFYRQLEFGTGGLRGIIGAGTNRMNVYTVGRVSQGLADYVKAHFPEGKRSIAVSYDSRIKSEYFSREASAVFAENGIKVYIYPELMPTPALSFAVRHLGCAAGVMMTASHNPSEYNGYKVYNSAGCQVTDEAASEISSFIDKADYFEDVSFGNWDELLEKGMISFIGEDTVTAYIENVKSQSLVADEEELDRDVAIVYTPLNGTGLRPVVRTLSECGYTNISVVEEQREPDGTFPTCPYPNPEIRQAMEKGIEKAKSAGADLLIATDPDCDRVGIAVKDNGEYRLLTGNETGILLTEYICELRCFKDTMPEDPLIIKTIVTTEMIEPIAKRWGVRIKDVLTGFKYIGEQIGFLEEKGEESRYVFGFEESYGYLAGTYVRDKDAVVASLMICDMFAYYRARGKSLPEKLAELYSKYGYYLNTLYSFGFEGQEGFYRMRQIMEKLRESGLFPAGIETVSVKDYSRGIEGLPVSDVLKFYLPDGGTVVVRPSGTEPKLKVYLSVKSDDEDSARKEEKKLSASVRQLFS